MFWIALLLGVVEGLTEFLPISSTGHLIIVSSLVGFEGKRAEVFQIFIQLGAVLSVVWEYRHRLSRALLDLSHRAEARRFVGNVALAFLPAAVIGLLVYDYVTGHLFFPGSVAAALITGSLLIFLVESVPLAVRTHAVEAISWRQALLIGFAQCLSLWPGFSRSTATILGGLAVGLDRRAATEFSFFLAIPVIFAAAFYELYQKYSYLDPGDYGWLALSFAVSFLVARASIRWLLRFISTHDFKPFAWYRLVVGGGVLLLYLL